MSTDYMKRSLAVFGAFAATTGLLGAPAALAGSAVGAASRALLFGLPA